MCAYSHLQGKDTELQVPFTPQNSDGNARFVFMYATFSTHFLWTSNLSKNYYLFLSTLSQGAIVLYLSDMGRPQLILQIKFWTETPVD